MSSTQVTLLNHEPTAENIAEAIMLVMGKQNALTQLANLARVNWINSHEKGEPYPSLKELNAWAKVNGWDKGSDEYFLLFFIENYFKNLKKKV